MKNTIEKYINKIKNNEELSMEDLSICLNIKYMYDYLAQYSDKYVFTDCIDEHNIFKGIADKYEHGTIDTGIILIIFLISGLPCVICVLIPLETLNILIPMVLVALIIGAIGVLNLIYMLLPEIRFSMEEKGGILSKIIYLARKIVADTVRPKTN